MSKVFKQTGDFVPEKIAPGEIPQVAEWGNITKGNSAGSSSSSSEVSGQAETTLESPESSSFDSDFSSPVAGSDIAGESVDSFIEKEPEIDLEALKEEFYNQGILEGREQLQEDYGSSLLTLQAVCTELNSIRETILQNSAAEIRELVIKIAEKIIRKSLAEQQESIINTVNDALQKAVKSDEFVISVHPDDLDTISSRSAEFIASINGLEKVVVKADSSIDQGGCHIESSNCTVDATIVSQMKIIFDHLADG